MFFQFTRFPLNEAFDFTKRSHGNAKLHSFPISSDDRGDSASLCEHISCPIVTTSLCRNIVSLPDCSTIRELVVTQRLIPGKMGRLIIGFTDFPQTSLDLELAVIIYRSRSACYTCCGRRTSKYWLINWQTRSRGQARISNCMSLDLAVRQSVCFDFVPREASEYLISASGHSRLSFTVKFKFKTNRQTTTQSSLCQQSLQYFASESEKWCDEWVNPIHRSKRDN